MCFADDYGLPCHLTSENNLQWLVDWRKIRDCCSWAIFLKAFNIVAGDWI